MVTGVPFRDNSGRFCIRTGHAFRIKSRHFAVRFKLPRWQSRNSPSNSNLSGLNVTVASLDPGCPVQVAGSGRCLHDAGPFEQPSQGARFLWKHPARSGRNSALRKPCTTLSGQTRKDNQYLAAALSFLAIRSILIMRASLSASFAVSSPAGGEMSGLTANFLFGANSGARESAVSAQGVRSLGRYSRDFSLRR